MPRFHCTYCQSELARQLERGTVRLALERASSIYALANGQHLIVCRCGRRNLLRAGRLVVAAPSDQDAPSPARFGHNEPT